MIGVVVGLAVAMTHAAHPCRALLPHGPNVPAPLVLHTSCGWYEHDSSGRTFRLPNHWGAIHGVGTGRRFGAQFDVCCLRTHHVGVTLHGRLVWRSRHAYPSFGGDVAFGPHELAFSDYDHGVYLTDLRNPERLVVRGRGIHPDDFTRNGDLVVVAHGELVIVSRAGRMVGTHRFRTSNGYAFDRRSDTYAFVTPLGRLARLRNGQVRLGPIVEPRGQLSIIAAGLIALTGPGRLAVMREDGSSIASAGWNPRDSTLVVGPGASPDSRSFVYELVRARSRRPGLAVPQEVATLYVLRRGDRHGHVLLRRWRSPVECVEGGPCAGGLDWNGRYFLYEPGDGHVGMVDSATGRLLDLTQLDRSLPSLGPRPEQAVIAWKRDFPR